MASRKLRACAGGLNPALAAGDDDRGRDLRYRLVARGPDYVQKNVLPLPSRRRRERRPCDGFAVAGNEPGERADIRGAFGGAWTAR